MCREFLATPKKELANDEIMGLMADIKPMARAFFRWSQPKRKGLVDVSLHEEQATFRNCLPHLLEDAPGKFVVINSRTILGVADDYPQALKLGYSKCGTKRPFLVQRIEGLDVAKRGSILLSKLQCVS